MLIGPESTSQLYVWRGAEGTPLGTKQSFNTLNIAVRYLSIP
jgi:hypothetical protein